MPRSIAIACLVIAGHTALPPSAAARQIPTDRAALVGVWVSESNTTNLTTLNQDGRFTTVFLKGLVEADKVSGRWLLRSNAMVWTYEGPNAPPGEDVNPFVDASPDRFTLRESDGKTSAFYRKGVPDPLSPAHLPIAIGTGWLLQDDAGEVAIRIGVRERIANRDCYRIDWIMGPMAYQSEYWFVDEAGVHAVGRKVLGRAVPFAAPYLLLKRTLTPGDTWSAAIKSAAFEDELKISVGAPVAVTTSAGTFDALPVTTAGRALSYRRWYAPGVGLVQEVALIGGEPGDPKKLKERLK